MKKSKLLLVLVVALLVCSMVMTLVACGPKDETKPNPNDQQQEQKPEPKPEPPTDAELSLPHIKAFNAAVANSLKVADTKKVGIDYGMEVPIADTADGQPQTVIVSLKGLLDVSANNTSKVQLAAKKKVGTAEPVEVFTFTADKDIYVSYPVTDGRETRKFANLDVPAMLAKLPNGLPAGSSVTSILGMVGAIAFGHAETNGNVISVEVKLTALSDLLVGLVAGMIDPDEDYTYISDSIKVGISEFVSNIEMTLNVTTNAENSIDKFAIDLETPWGPGHVNITPKMASDLVPVFEEVGANPIETNVLNFTLGGKFVMDQAYTYNVQADIDLVSVIRNVVTKVDLMGAISGKTVVGKGLENIFDGATTKLYAEVKDASDVLVAGLAIDYAADQTIHALINKTVPLLGLFLDGQKAYDKNADFVTFDINVAEQLAKKTAPADPNAPAVPAAPGKGVALVMAEPSDAEYAAQMKLDKKPAGTVSWTPVAGETYKVYVQGVEQTLAEGVSSVKATSGQVVRVDTVDAEGKVIATSSKTYVDGRATANAVSKFVSFLTATDFDYKTSSVVFNMWSLGVALEALDFATDINYVDKDGNAHSFMDIVGLLPVDGPFVMVSVSQDSKFYDVANHNEAFKPVDLLTAAAKPLA